MKIARRAWLAATVVVMAACSQEPIGIDVVGGKLVFTVQPGNTVAGGAFKPAVTVTIEDSAGHVITNATNAVTVKIDTGLPGLSGVTTVNAVHGVAIFDNLSIQTAADGYFLTAFSGTLPQATSAPFAVSPAAPARLSFITQPNTTWVAHSIIPGLQVGIQDAFANSIADATNAITLAMGRNPGGATLTGTTTVNAVNGIATFSNLSIDKPSPGYTLVASASGLTKAETAPFAIITPSISVRVDPFSDVVLGLDALQQLIATVGNDPSNGGVTWSLSCSGGPCGALSALHSASGAAITYTSPGIVPHPNSVFVTATSVSDPSKSATAWLTIRSSISVSISPAGFVGVDVSTTRPFTATVSNDPGNSGLTWTVSGKGCSGAACGTISPAGVYTAPDLVPTPATVTVAAASVTDYKAVDSVHVVVTTPGVVSLVVSPSSAFVCTGTTGYASSPVCMGKGWFPIPRSFIATAYVFNDPSSAGVTWSAGVGSFLALSPSGMVVRYTGAPNTCGSTVVTAASIADPTKRGTIAVRFCF